jgi:hypothetical protein
LKEQDRNSSALFHKPASFARIGIPTSRTATDEQSALTIDRHPTGRTRGSSPSLFPCLNFEQARQVVACEHPATVEQPDAVDDMGDRPGRGKKPATGKDRCRDDNPGTCADKNPATDNRADTGNNSAASRSEHAATSNGANAWDDRRSRTREDPAADNRSGAVDEC